MENAHLKGVSTWVSNVTLANSALNFNLFMSFFPKHKSILVDNGGNTI